MPDARPHWYGVLVTAPAAALFVYTVAITAAQQSASLGRFAGRLLLASLPLLVGLALILTVFTLRRTSRAGAIRRLVRHLRAPRSVFAVVLVSLVSNITRLWRRTRLAWDAQPGLAQPQSFESRPPA
jgi:hypothetical protein